MLETLRAYGARLLAEAGEQDAVASVLAGYALRVAEAASAELQTSAGEAAATQRLEAEDATTRQALAWATDHDPATALRLAVALGWWWRNSARLSGQYRLLSELAGQAEPGRDGWCAAQYWLGWAAMQDADEPTALEHFTAVRDALQDRGPSRLLADVVASRATALLNTGQLAEGTEEGRRSLAMARELGDPAAEALALVTLGIAAGYRGDNDAMVELIHRQQQIPESIPAHSRAGSTVLVGALIVSGDPAVAESTCAAALTQSRAAGDMPRLASLLNMMAYLYVRTGRFAEAAAHLREGFQIVMRAGDLFEMSNCLWTCTLLCAATGLPAEAVTLWAARDVHDRQHGLAGLAAQSPDDTRVEQQMLSTVRDALGPARAQAAAERGAAMSLDTAAQYALLLTAPAALSAAAAADGPGLAGLSARERELVTLVAQGYTNAQIAAQLVISVRTVGSHLDRIRDKTGCRRRADLTRLALAEGLV
jgi:DNA-binding CsgD family transcriptional regulator